MFFHFSYFHVLKSLLSSHIVIFLPFSSCVCSLLKIEAFESMF
ncbi:hypothetical protein Taro_056225 [Colocasia esculenta]|uniref:Uncharacterized protein n=1 Tax=Colocasia esculenta TaxID=4460 RepID=A0A843XVP3_COLES|nr:hypothetical protein [Colocasia esculenta]